MMNRVVNVHFQLNVSFFTMRLSIRFGATFEHLNPLSLASPSHHFLSILTRSSLELFWLLFHLLALGVTYSSLSRSFILLSILHSFSPFPSGGR